MSGELQKKTDVMISVKNKTILSDQFCWRLCSPHSYIVDGRTLDHEPQAHFWKHAVELEEHDAALLASLRPSERHFSDGLRGSHEDALLREIREELEMEITVGDLIDTIEYDYPTFHLSMKCFACCIQKCIIQASMMSSISTNETTM